MDQIFQEYLFKKHIFVHSKGQDEEPHAFETVFSLASLFGIRITSGQELAQREMIHLSSAMLGKSVPQPFYKGFPDSVRKLSPDQLLFDQMVHYAVTYGFGNFSVPGHSLLEEQVERLAFQENAEIRDFVILTEEEAIPKLKECFQELLCSTRPLNEQQLMMLWQGIRDFGFVVEKCASKNTAICLATMLEDPYFSKFLALSDVLKLVEEMQYRFYGKWDIKKLSLKNRDRKFLTTILDRFFEAGAVDLENCYERKALWCGLLHHLHYQPKCEAAEQFLHAMRNKGNLSVSSAFEKALENKDVRGAAEILLESKGSGALLRHLNYLMSRVERPEDLQFLLEHLETKNNILLMQLLLNYGKTPIPGLSRAFVFTKHNMLLVHSETPEECERRKSQITEEQAGTITSFLWENLEKNLKGRALKVYLDADMERIALPLQETTSQGGYGVLARGSRLPMPKAKVLRAFTYWEQVNDIDLSVIGMDEVGNQIEFSWRTMAGKQSDAIIYSGDETSGFHGGSEYFDVNLEAFRKEYPTVRYLVFCDNVFSSVPFSGVVCRAGYMLRDQVGSGEIFEPKTVQSSFTVNCNSTFAYLFALDLEEEEFIWLNVAREGGAIVAGETSLAFLFPYFETTKILNVKKFFELAATEIVSDPLEAQMIVSDKAEDWERACAEGQGDKEWIRSFDFERYLVLMN